VEGEKRSLDSGMVNEYIRNICCDNFTTKDFRTWTGTVYTIEALKELGCCETDAEAKKKIMQALDIVAKRLGNTRTVCKKYYVHPVILEMFTNKQLDALFQNEKDENFEKLSEAENILMKILESE